MIDMHIHTTYSDGEFTTEQILNKYVRDNHINIVSITDHDTFDGQEEAYEIARKSDFLYLYGAEFSTIYKDSCVHVLGYFCNMPDVAFQKYVKDTKIIAYIKLQRKKENLQNRGYYDIYDIVQKIHEHKGIAILAHPILYLDYIDELLSILNGAECIYPAHNHALIQKLLQKCDSRKLFCTAGTDLHTACDIESYREKLNEYFGQGFYEQKIRNWYLENHRGEI